MLHRKAVGSWSMGDPTNKKININGLGGFKKMFFFLDVLSTTDAGGHTAAGSMSSIRSKNFLENSVDWKPVVKKYRSLIDLEEEEKAAT